MSAAYRKMVSNIKELSKSINYNWWVDKLLQYLYWTIFILFIFAFFNAFSGTQEFTPYVAWVLMFILLILYAVDKYVTNKIASKESKIAEYIIKNEDINLAYIKQLINETETSISNARKVAQWGVGGILTILIFVGGQIINSLSAIISALIPVVAEIIPKDVYKFDAAKGKFDFLANLIPESLEIVFSFTLIIFGVLAIVYAVLQIHTLSNRRYLRLFKDIEYQLILGDTKKEH